jgi:hypothetical protein
VPSDAGNNVVVLPKQMLLAPKLTVGKAFTVKTIGELGILGVHVPLTSTSIIAPFSDAPGLIIDKVDVVTLLYGAVLKSGIPFFLHWYVTASVAVTLIVAVPLPAQNAAGAMG